MINHAQLRAFHAVAAQGSFTRAAAALNVTQPTLSGQVKALEDRFGIKLFERRGRGIEPTELGRSLHGVTRRIFALENEAEGLLAAARGLKRGSLKVSADAPYHIIPLLATFNRRHPGITLSVSFGNSETVRAAVLGRLTDIAVLPDVEPDERLHAQGFQRERIVGVIERDHPWGSRRSIRLSDLAEECLIKREQGSTTRAILERAMARAGVAAGAVMEVGSREAVREAVAARLGIGTVFESEFGNDERLKPLVIRDRGLEAMEYAVCLAERRDSPAVRAFFDLLPEPAD